MKCPHCDSDDIELITVTPKRMHYTCYYCGLGFYVGVTAKPGKHGPYFAGQEPSDKAGHYFPDVMRVNDFKVRSNVFVRLSHCIFCGYQVEEISARAALGGPGFAGMANKDPELAAWRDRKRKELRSQGFKTDGHGERNVR